MLNSEIDWEMVGKQRVTASAIITCATPEMTQVGHVA